ncbi:hypothetical protein NFI96_034595, partial [Prochilodus magdalenae]
HPYHFPYIFQDSVCSVHSQCKQNSSCVLGALEWYLHSKHQAFCIFNTTMFQTKLSLLALLIAASGVFISAEMNQNNQSVCLCISDSGLIRVKSAIYGRTDGTTCSTQRPSSELQNTNCALKIPLISKRCDGHKVCEFKTDVIGSPDPCVGTYKYYNTTYDCIQGNSSVACEYGYSTLDCGDKVIQIINANYGRTDSTTCSEGQSSAVTKNTNCYAPDTLATVVTWCNGRSKCTVQALYTIFTDPCFGTYKYLHASYSCLPRPTKTSVTCEGSNAVLKCETGILKIVNANYGRTDSTTCSAGRPSKEITKTNCYGSNTLAEVIKRCEGKTTCTVPAANSVFSDPCFGVPEWYLHSKHQAFNISSTTMFPKKLHLLALLIAASGVFISADSGLIRVKSAIYGRTDGTTCSTQRPSSELQNTNCALKIPLISK